MNSQYYPQAGWIAIPSRRSLFAPDLSEMLKSPLCDLFWGDIEHEAVKEALIRSEARIRELEELQLSRAWVYEMPAEPLECLSTVSLAF